ncbi:EAL domain-containing protein [Alishewanella tabrizica]|uniref:GGDEF domain-containing protein n=1 Tax=Alishewanella tabrizica TaxID=671278 RepID=A0ABQ2WKS7_9ALTE|nr:EAL domain-containing protein [Alishewanella tabrizica]GGW61535.1 GGDEF domain-containing protein [Alishewanella tabrizica]
MHEMLEDLGLLYRALMDSAADAIIVIDDNGLILHFSRSAELLFEYTALECQGKNVNMLMPEPYHSAHDKYLQNYHQTGNAKIIGIGRDVTGRKKSGAHFPMHLSVGKARIKDRACYIGICHDLSEYKKTLSEKLNIESLQNALFDAAVDGIITINEQGSITSFNRAAEQLFGYQKQEIIGQNVKCLMPSPYRESHDGYLTNYTQGGKVQIIGIGRDVPGLRKDGSIFPMRLSVGKAKTDGGKFYIGVCHDLTDYQNALIELAQAEQRYKSIVECQGQIICRLDAQYKLTFANKSFQRIFECSEHEVIGMHFINFIPGDKHEMQQILHEIAFSDIDTQLHFKTLMLRKSGKFNIEWWFTKLANENGVDQIQGFGIDISEKEEALREAAFLKNHDPLTGLLNIDTFTAALPGWMTGQRYAILYTDCNHFGLINNRFGFDVGDIMLIESSRRLKICMKQPAMFCRPGADEFIIAVGIYDVNDALMIAESVLDALSKPYHVAENEIRVSVKIGVSIFPDDANAVTHVIRQAESVLARAKLSQNNIAFYDPVAHGSLQRQLDVEQRLRLAIEHHLLQVFLQPKTHLSSQQVVGYEALLRWNDPILGFVSPIEFIKVAEQMLLATMIDRYVLKTVFLRIRRCLDENITVLPIAVNITSSHFGDPSLLDYIFSLSREHQVPLTYIALEVTEGVLLEMNAQVQQNLFNLRQQGVKIAIDDFGTGYSSLSYIRKLAVDAIKIDKSFIDDLSDEVGQQLISAILAIAQAVKLEVIAEGVETEQQRQLLLQLGCDFGQGYLFAKPAFIDDVLFKNTPNETL